MRARQLKPAFFCKEQIASLPYEWRLLRAGLDLLADRAGRLIDAPKQIKRDLFAWDALDVNAGLSALARAGFITRYAAGDDIYVQITDFDQTPSKREPASIIPGLDASDAIVIEAHDLTPVDAVPAYTAINTGVKPSPTVPINGSEHPLAKPSALSAFLSQYAASTPTRGAT